MSYEGWVMAGHVITNQEDTPWLRRHGSGDAFQWGGRCMRVEESTEVLGEVTVTQRQNPRGGLERDSVLVGPPGETSFTLAMKRLQADRKKTDLKSCFWDIDQRTHCGDLDAWNKWLEIKRHCHVKLTERVSSGSGYDGDKEEQMVSFSAMGLYTEDIRRVTGEIGAPLAGMTAPLAIMFKDVSTCQPARCPDWCDSQEECVVVAVTETVALGTPYLAVSLYGGDLDAWTDAPLALTAFGAFDANGVACLGEFLVVVSNGAGSIIYSDDRGTTQVEVTTTAMTAHPPNQVDMLDQSFIVVVGDDGYIFTSYDAARTWFTADAGNATTSNLTRVMIAPSDPLTIYAVSSAADVTVKSENGARTWAAMTAAGVGGTGITALCVDPDNKNRVLIGTDAGEVFESLNGAVSWTEQDTLAGITAATKANTTIADIVSCGCGVYWLITENSSDDVRKVYRNVDAGATGKWFEPDSEAVAAGKSLTGIACCGPNAAVAVGGETVVSDVVVLLE